MSITPRKYKVLQKKDDDAQRSYISRLRAERKALLAERNGYAARLYHATKEVERLEKRFDDARRACISADADGRVTFWFSSSEAIRMFNLPTKVLILPVDEKEISGNLL